MHIAQTTSATTRDEQVLAMLSHIPKRDLIELIGHYGPQWHADIDVITLFSVLLLAHSLYTVLSLVRTPVTKIYQGIQTGIALKIDTAAITPITAIRATILDVLFPAK